MIARRLENVAVDFEAAGLRFPTMYEKISIPGDSQWITSCRDRIAVRFRQAWATVPEHFRPAADFDMYQEQDAIDFARLTPADQQAVLTRMAGDAGFEREAQSRAPRLVSHLVEPPDASIIEHNARIVSECYSSERQSEQLLRIYRSLSTAASDDTVTGPSSTRPAVEWIAAQRRFYPCRTETMADG